MEITERTATFTVPDANVFVVDDMLTNIKMVKGLLMPYGMQVSLCKNGEMALGAIGTTHFDMVFMNHLMPSIDGVETTEQIKSFGTEDKYYADVR